MNLFKSLKDTGKIKVKINGWFCHLAFVGKLCFQGILMIKFISLLISKIKHPENDKGRERIT